MATSDDETLKRVGRSGTGEYSSAKPGKDAISEKKNILFFVLNDSTVITFIELTDAATGSEYLTSIVFSFFGFHPPPFFFKFFYLS